MSEFGIQTPEHLLADVRAEQNKTEEAMRETKLSAWLFRDDFEERLLNEGQFDIQTAFLSDQFLLDKKDKTNMGEVFDLAINPPYVDAIHVVELGSTTDPGKQGNIDGLKHDYIHLLDWLIAHTEVDGEIPRSESTRRLQILPSRIAERDGSFVVMERTRSLVRDIISHGDMRIEIRILKRMIFTLPKGTGIALSNRGKEGLEFLEDVLLPQGLGGIKPIRTAYYLATDIIK